MKYAGILVPAYLLLPVFLFAQAGSSCSTPINLTLDGVVRSYSSSATTDTAVVCTNYTTVSPVTWFAFTTNATAACPLLQISASDHQVCEVAMYSGCGGNMSNNLYGPSSICFDDGEGLWAPAETQVLLANQTYYLRIKTNTACSIEIAGEHHIPENDDCSGATSIGEVSLTDNNSCHHGGPDVTPDQLCALTLENTAFYQFYVATNGSSIINITDISCDNGMINNNNGFQIGFFKGSCAALIPINCTSGSGSFVQATTDVLTAGTHVYVAIDGTSGSNCKYTITGINAYGVLSASEFKNFSGWKTSAANTLKWESIHDLSLYYEVERSENGADFKSIGRVNGIPGNGKETVYNFEDKSPFQNSFYRVKRIGYDGKVSMSHTIKVNRKETPGLKAKLVNPVVNNLDMVFESDFTGQLEYTVMSLYGQVFLKGKIKLNSGVNRFNKEVSKLPPGKYLISLTGKGIELNQSFIKFN